MKDMMTELMNKTNKYLVPLSYAFIVSFWPCTVIYCLINAIVRRLSFNDYKITLLLARLELFPYYVLFFSLVSFLLRIGILARRKEKRTARETVFHLAGDFLAVILFVLTIIPNFEWLVADGIAFLLGLFLIFKDIILKNKSDLFSIWTFISVLKIKSFWISLLIITFIEFLIMIVCIALDIPFLLTFGIICLVLGLILLCTIKFFRSKNADKDNNTSDINNSPDN